MTSPADPAVLRGMPAGAFAHAGVFAAGPEALAAALAAPVRAAAEAGTPVIAAVSDRLGAALARASRGAELRFTDRAAHYDAPGRAAGALHRIAVSHAATGALFIGEPLLPDHAGELDHWRHAEAALHEALRRDRLQLLCAHDTRVLTAAAAASARAAHPHLRAVDGQHPNPGFRPAARGRADTAGRSSGGGGGRVPPPAEPEPSAHVLPLGRDLAAVRSGAEALAEAVGLPSARHADLVVAVNELAANIVEHGGGTGRLVLWRAGDRIVCEVRDTSTAFNDTLAGQRPAEGLQGRGYGLWITRQVCDFFEVVPSPRGTLVRLVFRAPRQGR
ncbi:anti-sigma factor RsbA family regulatory protein [Nocardiopsis coralliicola]